MTKQTKMNEKGNCANTSPVRKALEEELNGYR